MTKNLRRKLMKRGMVFFILVKGFLFTGVAAALANPLMNLVIGDPIEFGGSYWMTISVWGLIGSFISAIEYVYFEQEDMKCEELKRRDQSC